MGKTLHPLVSQFIQLFFCVHFFAMCKLKKSHAPEPRGLFYFDGSMIIREEEFISWNKCDGTQLFMCNMWQGQWKGPLTR